MTNDLRPRAETTLRDLCALLYPATAGHDVVVYAAGDGPWSARWRWAARERRAAYQRDYTPDWIARRVADGRCAACRTRMAPPDRATCQPCRDAITARRDRRRADRISAGLCGDCGKHPLASTARCTDCLARDAARHARRKAHMEGLR